MWITLLNTQFTTNLRSSSDNNPALRNKINRIKPFKGSLSGKMKLVVAPAGRVCVADPDVTIGFPAPEHPVGVTVNRPVPLPVFCTDAYRLVARVPAANGRAPVLGTEIWE